MKIFFFRETELNCIDSKVIRERGVGATEHCFISLAETLSKLNDVYVCCPCGITTYENVRYINFKDYCQVIQNINLIKPDVIIIVGNPKILFHEKNYGSARIIFWQHNHPDEVKHFPIKSLLENIDLKIVFPSLEARDFARIYYKNFEKIFGIYNGIRQIFFEKANNQKEEGKIIYNGSLVRSKGLLELLNVVNRLRKYSFYICGGFEVYGGKIDKQYLTSCEALMARAKNIFFMGLLNVNDLAEQISSSELCIANPIVGNKETFCCGAVEAMATNTLVLTGYGDIINPIISRGGFYYENNLKLAIETIMTNEKLRFEKSNNGQEWVKQLTWHKITNQWQAFLEEKNVYD